MSNQRRDRTTLQMFRYAKNEYPIVMYPPNREQDAYAGSYGRLPQRRRRNAKYGNKKGEYGWLQAIIGIGTAIGGAYSNHLLAKDAQDANLAIAQGQQQVEAAKEANKPYLYMAGAFVLGSVALGVAMMFRK